MMGDVADVSIKAYMDALPGAVRSTGDELVRDLQPALRDVVNAKTGLRQFKNLRCQLLLRIWQVLQAAGAAGFAPPWQLPSFAGRNWRELHGCYFLLRPRGSKDRERSTVDSQKGQLARSFTGSNAPMPLGNSGLAAKCCIVRTSCRIPVQEPGAPQKDKAELMAFECGLLCSPDEFIKAAAAAVAAAASIATATDASAEQWLQGLGPWKGPSLLKNRQVWVSTNAVYVVVCGPLTNQQLEGRKRAADGRAKAGGISSPAAVLPAPPAAALAAPSAAVVTPTVGADVHSLPPGTALGGPSPGELAAQRCGAGADETPANNLTAAMMLTPPHHLAPPGLSGVQELRTQLDYASRLSSCDSSHHTSMFWGTGQAGLGPCPADHQLELGRSNSAPARCMEFTAAAPMAAGADDRDTKGWLPVEARWMQDCNDSDSIEAKLRQHAGSQC